MRKLVLGKQGLDLNILMAVVAARDIVQGSAAFKVLDDVLTQTLVL